MQTTTNYINLLNQLCKPIGNSLIGTKAECKDVSNEFKNILKGVEDTRICEIYSNFYQACMAKSSEADVIEAFKLHPIFLNKNFDLCGTPLSQAINARNFEYAKKLIKAGADINAASFRGDQKDIFYQNGPYISALHRALHGDYNVIPIKISFRY